MNIYVSNLSYYTTKDSLEELFETYGMVASVKIAFDRATRRSLGYGFVEMPDDINGQYAIDHLNQTEFEGNIINVSIAAPRTERSYNNGGYNNGGYGNNRNSGNNRYNNSRRY